MCNEDLCEVVRVKREKAIPCKDILSLSSHHLLLDCINLETVFLMQYKQFKIFLKNTAKLLRP